jgi:dipeptidyl aminopeptidase/acylaminoacyl peptidase
MTTRRTPHSSSLAGLSLCMSASAILLLASLKVPPVIAQSEIISPGKNIETTGVPPIPGSLAREVDPYRGAYGLPLAGWNPIKREIWLKGLSSVTWISSVKNPGATPETSSIYIKSSGIYDIYLQPQNQYLAYTRDVDGNEQFQLYLYAISGGKSTLLSDGKTRSTEPVWSNRGDKIVYSSAPTAQLGVDLRLVNPFEPTSDRLMVQSSSGYLKAYDWSPDDKQVVYCDFSANVASTLWLIDVASGNKTLLSPKGSTGDLYDNPQFSRDGKGIYVITDHDSDMRRVAYIDLASRKYTYVPSEARWDVEEFQLSPNGKLLAFLTNEDGISRLHVFDTEARKEIAVPQNKPGVLSDLKWNSASTEIAFNFKSAQTPNDVYSVNIETGKQEVWARSITNGVDTEKFAMPELIHWPSFDKRTLSGFLYRPPNKFTAKSPVIIHIHGGPEEQFRPTFRYAQNYYLNELGVTRIYPNVRGSSGYGKAFLDLDNGLRREDAVKDIGALLDWIKTQPDLDADRVLVEGSSYGGYLALSTACNYPDRIKAAISDSGIVNLGGFITSTKGWRVELQRSEFGDERNPKTKKFMESTAPLNNANKIKVPLLIIQGQNDPRVPPAEAARLVAVAKRRVPVWYILAKDEGHGFAQAANRDFQLYTTIMFVKEFLLK